MTEASWASILEQEGRLGPETTKTVTEVRFEVPEGAREIALSFDYQPRESRDREVNHEHVERAFEEFSATFRARLGDAWAEGLRAKLNIEKVVASLSNLLNVVLIDADGKWRGRWDRNPASDDGRLRLGVHEASAGFIAGHIPSGTWRAAIECHGIYGAPVLYKLHVESSPGELEPADQLAPTFTIPAPAPDEKPRWLIGEMHSHSTESDGNWSIDTLCKNVAKDGAQFVFLTDHNTMSGHRDPPEVPLTLVPGCELTTFFGHYPTYGVNSAPVWHQDGEVRPFEQISAEVRERGGMIGAAHPFVPGDPLCTGCRMRANLDPSLIDTMEVWYRRWDSPGVDNEAAYELWNQFWRDGHRVTAVGARDVHRDQQLHPFPGEMPFTAIRAKANTPTAIFAGLRRREVVITGGPMVDFKLLGETQSARVGQDLSETPTKARVRLWNMEPNLELRLFAKGEVVERISNPGDGEIEVDIPKAAQCPGWFRVELRNDNQMPRAITNHVVALAA